MRWALAMPITPYMLKGKVEWNMPYSMKATHKLTDPPVSTKSLSA